MKGVVFTEFLEMVEDRFSPDMADQIIEGSDLPSGGVYTAVGTYDHAEMVALVSCLSSETQMPVPDLLKVFGEHLFGRFVAGFPHFFKDATTSFQFLSSVEGYIHVEVRKLYPDAELPTIDCETPQSDLLTLVYRSSRGLADLAEGLIRGCIAHFGESIAVTREDRSGGRGTEVLFQLQLQS